MKHLLALLLLMIAAALPLAAQSPDWQLNYDEDIAYALLSPNGKYLVFGVDKGDGMIQCLDAVTGKELWSKPVEDLYELGALMFIDDQKMLLGYGSTYKFVNPADGSMVAEFPVVGESWDDLLNVYPTEPGEDSLRTYYSPDTTMAIFYFDDGFQVIDLKKNSVVFESTCEISGLKYKEWENTMMIWPQGGCDSLYVIDREEKKMIFTGSLEDHEIHSQVYQSFVTLGDRMLLFNEDDIESIDLSTGKVDAVIKVDPDDPDVFLPVISKEDMYLLTSSDDTQRFYDPKTGRQIWQAPKGEIPGVVDQMTILDNGEDAFAYVYEEDGKMLVYKLNIKNGKVQWKKTLFEQEDSFEPGHMRASSTLAVISAVAVNILANTLSRATASRTYMGGGYYRTSYTQYRINWDGVYASTNRDKASEGYAKTVDFDEDKITLVTAGRMYTALQPTEKDDYDGEGFVTLSMKDGSVISSQPAEIIVDSDADEFNAVQELNSVQFPEAEASAVVGVHDVYILEKEGNIIHYPFGEEGRIIYFPLADTTGFFFIVHYEDDQIYDYWYVNARKSPIQKILIGRSYEDNIVFADTNYFAQSLYITEDGISAFDPISEITETTFDNPAWTLTEEELDRMELGDLDENMTIADQIQGIRPAGPKYFLMGTDGLGCVSVDGVCKWSHEWSPEWLEVRRGITEKKDLIVYSIGDETRLISNSCQGDIVGRHEIDHSDARILIGEKSIVVIDIGDGIISGYRVL